MNLAHRRVATLAAVLLPFPAPAQEQAPSAPSIDETLVPYASTQDSVRLPDGRTLHFVCMGEGSPTVILTAGLGDWSSTWRKVQPVVAQTTRVCAWDRPGFGLSDASPADQTAATTTADLEAALASSAIHAPYIMAGHSLGSYETLLFTDRHPDAVIGMVLIDPSIPDQFARFARVAPEVDMIVEEGIALMRKCAANLRDGTVAVGKPDPNGCLRPLPPAFPAALREALTPLRGPERFETVASLNSTVAESSALAVNSVRNYRDMPLIVLTATGMELPEALAEEINSGHDELAALSSRGVNARVPGANHAIQQVKPQVVIDAIEGVVREARESLTPPPT